ncbi:p13 [Cryptophlebia peltastica nucleopolyhedrovirus]|uniref:p13 n=1 Tax=Cryptophlebia peltastica nucleopolyhedrovirus TaxID=2304025 RepID=A0A346RNV7_9ABAC|nr:p13 [Cryptophlebia peltastica nucleopolyhedrovirus]AXS67754.1 p13 [Cryptophlebia peltastica nucleopolyhedrovirus]
MYAYVTFVMLGDEYVKGAIALAKSLIVTGTKHELVCMVTNDVSKYALKLLSSYYKIVSVEYIHYKCPSMLTKRQNQLYGTWINYAFTKWTCLKLIQYDKIIYLDADHLVIKNIDHMFDLNAPAICFTDESYGYYDKIVYGQTISSRAIQKFMRQNKVLCKGGTVLFEPNVKLFELIKKLVNKSNPCLTRNYYHNGFDEQVLLQALIKLNMPITQLSILYAWNAGTYHRLSKNHEPFVINYYGDLKPWNFADTDVINYMDVFIWRYFSNLNL